MRHKQLVPQVPGGFFHDLWIWLKKCGIQNIVFHKCLVDFSTTCGFFFKLHDTKPRVPQVLGGPFYDLWSLLQKIKRKTVSSTGGLWIFPQPMDISVRNLNMTWTDKDLKRKKIKERERGGKC